MTVNVTDLARIAPARVVLMVTGLAPAPLNERGGCHSARWLLFVLTIRVLGCSLSF
jgi:hypothetical protein